MIYFKLTWEFRIIPWASKVEASYAVPGDSILVVLDRLGGILNCSAKDLSSICGASATYLAPSYPGSDKHRFKYPPHGSLINEINAMKQLLIDHNPGFLTTEVYVNFNNSWNAYGVNLSPAISLDLRTYTPEVGPQCHANTDEIPTDKIWSITVDMCRGV